MGFTIAILITTITSGSFVFQPNDAFASKGKLTSLTLIYESSDAGETFSPVDIAVTDKKGNSQGTFTGVLDGDMFTVDILPIDKEHFESKTFFTITFLDTSGDEDVTVTLDVIEIHTSCSQPLEDGDIHPGTSTQLIIFGNYCEEEGDSFPADCGTLGAQLNPDTDQCEDFFAPTCDIGVYDETTNQCEEELKIKKHAPSITLVKLVENDPDGTEVLPDAFQFTIDGNPVEQGVAHSLIADQTHVINEIGVDGYSVLIIEGDGHCPETLPGTVTLSKKQHITCTITNTNIEGSTTIPGTGEAAGTIFHHESIQFTTVSATSQTALEDNCDVAFVGLDDDVEFNCVEAGRFYVNGEDKFLIVDSELAKVVEPDKMIILFSVVEDDIIPSAGFAESPLCLLSGIGTHTSTGYLDDENMPTGYVDLNDSTSTYPFTPNGKLGFEISCTDLKVGTNYNVNYALIRT